MHFCTNRAWNASAERSTHALNYPAFNIQYMGVARNFDWGGEANWKKFCDVILVTFFGDVVVMTSLKRRHNYIFEVWFVIISFKNHYLAKSWNFKSPILKVKERSGGAWGLLKICY